MTDLTASHYLRIYRIKLGIAESRISAGKPAPALKFYQQLVAALSNLEPEAPVHLEASEKGACFTDGVTGAVLGTISFLGDG
jgi:hypothetical protein